MLDGATFHNERWIGFAISDGENMFYPRSEKAEGMTAEHVEAAIQKIVDDLRLERIYVCSLVAGNARSIQNAMDECGLDVESDSDEEFEIGEEVTAKAKAA